MSRFFWILRALIYRPFFGKFGFPSYIGKPVFLYGVRRMFIGKNVRIFPNVRLEVHGKNTLEIGNNVAIGQNVHITSASNLKIGDSSTILANVFITNIDHNYEELGTHVLKQRITVRETIIGENCYIGIGACIQAGTILGKQCVVGANAVVRGNFEDYSVLVGAPAKVVKRYNPASKNWERTNSFGKFEIKNI